MARGAAYIARGYFQRTPRGEAQPQPRYAGPGIGPQATLGSPSNSCTSLFSLSELPLVLVSGLCVRPAGAFARTARPYTLRFSHPPSRTLLIHILGSQLSREPVFGLFGRYPAIFSIRGNIISSYIAHYSPVLSLRPDLPIWSRAWIISGRSLPL